MNRLLPVVAAALVAAAWLSGPPALAQTKPQEELQQLMLDLRELKGLVGGVTDKVLRDRMEKSVLNLETRVGALQKALGGGGGSPEPAKKAVADADFQKFLSAVKKQAFDDEKLKLLKDYVKGNWFSCAQAATLVKQFSFSDGQVQSAVALHPRLVDPANFFEVLGVLTFDSDKKKIRDTLGLK
jgi:hypothetical protein